MSDLNLNWVKQNFDENNLAECPESGQKYRLTESGHALIVQRDNE